ncbi:RNA polymerase sigma factor [Nitrosomonas ureae]|uniref:RNA polymerase, sigma subunit, ECF family n=1 Tax=Nitrosomonas ureae TaxID=44577 RepID=A0A1H5UJD0_9PROT|nr:RNA polymerase sigma factor [Nitrosomonas ureae]SEF75144.1 RNA polymerase, sigma subunit, ECF family [Nitrosomonas ureae]
MKSVQDYPKTVEQIYRNEFRRVLATLIRFLGDIDQAEEALHDAFKIALEQWPQQGIPDNPRAWLVSVGRFKAIDKFRRNARFDSIDEIPAHLATLISPADDNLDESLEDDQLRLIFTCCHPSLSPEAQIALTLREICGLSTEEIAHAFLIAPKTVAQRIVRAKAKIRDARIPYEVPELEHLSDRLDSVLKVIYLVFNESYSTSSGIELMRHDLSAEAIRLGRLLLELMPSEPEIPGLLALMLLQDSRRAARINAQGDLILLDEQDRSLWNRDQVNEGVILVKHALGLSGFGAYTLQAAIAAVHAEAPSAGETDWREIVGLYNVLKQIYPSPIVELNRAVAVAMRDGPAMGLELIEALISQGQLVDYHFMYAAKADFHRKLGQRNEAIEAYQHALQLTQQEPERRFLQKRLTELQNQ